MLTSVPALRGARFRLGSAPCRRSISIGKCRDRAGRRRVGSILIHVAHQTAPVRLGRTLLPSSLASLRDRSAVANREGKGETFFFWQFYSSGRVVLQAGRKGADGPCPVRCRERFRHRRLPAGDALTGNGMLRFPSQTATQPVKRPIQRELGNHTMSQERTACRLCSILSNRRF